MTSPRPQNSCVSRASPSHLLIAYPTPSAPFRLHGYRHDVLPTRLPQLHPTSLHPSHHGRQKSLGRQAPPYPPPRETRRRRPEKAIQSCSRDVRTYVQSSSSSTCITNRIPTSFSEPTNRRCRHRRSRETRWFQERRVDGRYLFHVDIRIRIPRVFVCACLNYLSIPKKIHRGAGFRIRFGLWWTCTMLFV